MNSATATMPTPLVDVYWLQAHLNAPHVNVVVVDCRFALGDPHQGHQEYLAGHIPGADYLDLNRDLSSPVQRHGGRHPLPDLATLVSQFAQLGIASQPATPVVAYDATKGAFASRLWWLLRYLGHESVAVLDGGFPAWQAAGYPLETAVPEPRSPQPFTPQPFTPQVQTHWVVDRDAVMQCQQQPETGLVDARSPERYRGEQEPIDPIAGAIPGAKNFFWQSNLDDRGRFLPPAELAQRWATMPAGADTIYYCGSGVTACVNLLAQAVMGQDLPKLYVGGWSDWCSYHHPPS